MVDASPPPAEAVLLDLPPYEAMLVMTGLQGFHDLRGSITTIQPSKPSPPPHHHPHQQQPPRKHITSSEIKQYQDCFNMLSAIFEVSENFERSSDVGFHEHKKFLTFSNRSLPHSKRSSSVKVPIKNTMSLRLPIFTQTSMKAPTNTRVVPPTTMDAQKTTRPKQWVHTWLHHLLRKVASCYIGCMLSMERRGDLSGIAGGHAMATVELPLRPFATH